MKNTEEWHKIGDRLTSYFAICSCQRKLKSIIDNLYSIYIKIENQDYNFTGAEWLLIAFLDATTNSITHGINCEYPIIRNNDPLWKWIIEVKDSPYLEDN